MTRNWYETEQDVRLRHAADRRAAAAARRAGAARRRDRAGRGPEPARRLLARLGGWLIAWRRRLQAAPGELPRPATEPL